MAARVTIRKVLKDDRIQMPLKKSGAVMNAVPEDGVIVSMLHSRTIYVPKSRLLEVLETGGELEFDPWEEQ